MDHRIHQIPNRFALDFPSVKEKPQAAETEFREIFQKELSLKISKHASERLEERNIHIDKKQWHLIEDKMNEARRKGITDSLVVTKDATLLVSTTNNTVITALDREEASDRIFTNINGTIIINS